MLAEGVGWGGGVGNLISMHFLFGNDDKKKFKQNNASSTLITEDIFFNVVPCWIKIMIPKSLLINFGLLSLVFANFLNQNNLKGCCQILDIKTVYSDFER